MWMPSTKYKTIIRCEMRISEGEEAGEEAGRQTSREQLAVSGVGEIRWTAK